MLSPLSDIRCTLIDSPSIGSRGGVSHSIGFVPILTSYVVVVVDRIQIDH